MTAAAQIALFDDGAVERDLSVVPTCGFCGARGEPIPVDGGAGAPWNAAAIWALLTLTDHERAGCPARTEVTSQSIAAQHGRTTTTP